MNENMINFVFLYKAFKFSRHDTRQKKTKMKKKVPVSIHISQHSKVVFTLVGLQQQERSKPLDNSEDMLKKSRNTQNIKVEKLNLIIKI